MDPVASYVPFDLLPILGAALVTTLVTCWLERNLAPSPRKRKWGIGVLLLFVLICLVACLYAVFVSGSSESGAGRPASSRGIWVGGARPGDSATSRPSETARW